MGTDILFKVEGWHYRAALGADHAVHDARPGHVSSLPPALLRTARVLVTSGVAGASARDMDMLPGLGLICCLGTGYENVDVSAAKARGILVTHGAGANARAVADHAFALLLACMRDIPRLDRTTREGLWRDGAAARPIPSGKKLGVVGMGAIGERIARRATAFDMEVRYHTRTPRPHLALEHVRSVAGLAEWADCLMVAVPGGASTFHLVDDRVLEALGPAGFLVNVGRGSVVDTAALVAVLDRDGLAGAALDVFEDEPHVPAGLLRQPRVVLTPHVAAWAPEVQAAAVSLLRRNLDCFLRGEPVVTPIPELAGFRA